MVRKPDRDELWAAALKTPEQVMREGIEASDMAFTGLIDDRPVVMWGVVKESLICDVATPWMVATSALDRHAATFLRRCKGMVDDMLARYGNLRNFVDARNVRAIRWLEAMGFTLEEPKPYGALNMNFHRFSMRRT